MFITVVSLQALQAVERYKGQLKADSLQRLHAMHNLHQLLNDPKLKIKLQGVPRTLRDSSLITDAEAIRQVSLIVYFILIDVVATAFLPDSSDNQGDIPWYHHTHWGHVMLYSQVQTWELEVDIVSMLFSCIR